MDDLLLVIKLTKRIEYLLTEYYHATGDDLAQMVESCQERLPNAVMQPLNLVTQIASEALHDNHYHLADTKQFLIACKQCEQLLTPRSVRRIWYVALLLIVLVTGMSLWFYANFWPELIH
ncbi:MAG: DUF4145 domain-containing protein [Vibrionaceae bacterium]